MTQVDRWLRAPVGYIVQQRVTEYEIFGILRCNAACGGTDHGRELAFIVEIVPLRHHPDRLPIRNDRAGPSLGPTISSA